MQHGCSKRFVIHVHAGQDIRRAQRVLQQRCAGQFDLPGIQRAGQFAGLAYQVDFCRRKSPRQVIEQGLDIPG